MEIIFINPTVWHITVPIYYGPGGIQDLFW